ncbi:MAG: Y-family DNA polymerase [Legionellales bacterium]|nr:Y-family DNA polymerase [Legionellales bacterium]
MYALVDCNNFYASCERVFNPALKHKPIVILSNNDGCVIARSNEAKAIGIPMGLPYFQCKTLIEQSHTHVFSSNYTLYGDMSSRIMSLLSAFTPEYEIYSIDEAFLKLDSLAIQDHLVYASKIQQHILKSTGIPVSVGIGPTKTLAKVANYIAKKKTLLGLFEIHAANVEEMLASLAVEDIWGIGNNLGKRLRQMHIHSALDFKQASPVKMRKQFSVVVEKIVHELNSLSCLGLNEIEPKQSITSSRSFGIKVTELARLKEAIAYHSTIACTKMRKQHSFARGIYVFIKTSKHNEKQPYYRNAITVTFESPLNDTGLIIQQALQAIEKIFCPHLSYHKAGVMLLDLIDASLLQPDLFSPSPNRVILMEALDKINAKFQKGALFYAAEGIQKKWQMKRGKKSSDFTTNWKELAIAYAK